jgi:hypothetical protein
VVEEDVACGPREEGADGYLELLGASGADGDEHKAQEEADGVLGGQHGGCRRAKEGGRCDGVVGWWVVVAAAKQF